MRSPSPRTTAAPSVVAVTVVSGTGMAAVLATSVGLFPLYGQPAPGLDGWRQVAPDLLTGLRESLLIALPATVIAGLVGLLLAGLALSSSALAGGHRARLVRVGCLLVLAVPHLVGATTIGLLLADGGAAARWLGATGSWPPLVAGPWPTATVLELAWKESAFVALVVLASVGPGHRRRTEVAAALGASPWQRWARVLVPASLPALGAACLVVLVYAVGSYEVASLLGRVSPEPLPVLSFRLFDSIELADRPAAAAAAGVSAALALGLATSVLAAFPGVRRSLVPTAAPEPTPPGSDR